MTNSDPSLLDIQRRFAAVERRLTKLEMSVGEIDRVIDPEGWIGEAFEVLDKDLADIKAQMESMDSKLDVIMRHITGISDTQ